MDELTASRLNGLEITAGQWEQMKQDVERRAPEEACGMVLGIAGRARQVIPVTNVLHSPLRFRMHPQEQLAAFERMEQEGLELSAIYHSHPQGPDTPSPTDIAEAFYPDALTLIWSRAAGDWICRGFWIRDGRVSEAPLSVIPDE